MKAFKILTALLFLTLLTARAALAEEGKKIAYMNPAKVFDGYYKTAEAAQKLENKAKGKNSERDKMVDEINRQRDEVELLSPDVRKKKEDELSEKMRKLQDFDNDTRVALQREKNDIFSRIAEEISAAVTEYGKSNGYALIFDDRALVYSNEALDISDKVLEVLNKKK